MDGFAKLRTQARARRDAAIAIARAQYRRAMRDLRVLETDYEDDDCKPTAVSLVQELIPSRPFSIFDLLVWFREVNPDSQLRLATIRQALMTLAEQGEVKRLANDRDGVLMWAPADWGARPATTAVSIAQAVADVLEDAGPLTAIEIAIVLHDRGYRAYLSERKLYAAVYSTLTHTHSAKWFVEGADGRWRRAAG
jgi:hypothetical protein